MGKPSSIKRLSTMSQSASKSIDTKARKRIEELYELTDEIINAYNEINGKYVHQIYRKYKQLQEINTKLKEKLNHHHCSGCKCTIQTNGHENGEEEEEHENPLDDEQTKNTALPSSTTSSVITRTKKKNPFIISDIEDTQNFDPNDSRFDQNISDDDDDDEGNKTSTDVNPKAHKAIKNNNNESEEESEEDDVNESNNNEDDGMARLPLALQKVIQRKAKKNKNAKSYLLQITHFPALCEFLRDKSHTSFDQRPSEHQVRLLITNHLSQHLANDKKTRVRVRDELREIHRSYMRTFMTDPHSSAFKPSVQKNKQINVKKSPM